MHKSARQSELNHSVSGLELRCAYARDMCRVESGSGCPASGFCQGHSSDAKTLVSPTPHRVFSKKPMPLPTAWEPRQL